MRKWILTALLSLQINTLSATTLLVTNANDSGPGSLRSAIDLASTGDIIHIAPLGSPILLSSNLPIIDQSITIHADNNQVINGNSAFRVFATNQASLILNNIAIENGLAQGGTGGSSLAYSGGGGGGLGAGGGIYVDLNQILTLSNTSITQSVAQGGNGGDATPDLFSTVLQGGGGGGASWSVLSSNGGTSVGGGDYPGGEGLINRGGDPHEGSLGYGGGHGGAGGVGSGGIGGGNQNGGSINSTSNNGANGGYAGGGGGGGGIAAGGGGNGGGQGGNILNAYFGGGGGGYGSGGSGGYVSDSAYGAGGGGGGLGGGGGGGTGGGNNGGGGGGGFGAGGGGGASYSGGIAGEGGNFGGRGGDGGGFGIAGGGGGGAGIGGAIFVGDSALLNIGNNVTLINNQAIGGVGGNGGDFNGSPGVGYAPDIFLFRKAVLNFIGTDPSQTISFVIGSDPNAPANHQDGGVIKDGTGTVILTSSNNYLGDTKVNLGNLVLNGSIAKNVIVNSGGVLSGTGTIGGDLIISGGSSAPGNSIGTLNVNGNYTQDFYSTYQVQINLTDSTLLNIAGMASLDGEAMITPINNLFTPNFSYLILQANGGVYGNFKFPRLAVTSLYVPLLIYDASHVYLVISPLSIARYDLQQNTLGVGNTIDSIVNAIFNENFNLQGNLLSAIQQLTLYFNDIDVNNVLKTFTPLADGAFVAQSFNAARFVFGLASERMLHQHLAYSGYPSGDIANTNYGSWIKVFGQYANQDSRNGVDGYKDNMGGIAIGSDITVHENGVLGLALSWANVDIDHFVSDAKTTANSYQLTAYGEYDFNCPWYITAFGGIARNNYETQRQIISGIVLLSPQGAFDGWQYSVKGEIGYDYKIDNIHIIPLISLFYSHLDVEGYTETGAGNAGLIVNGQDFDTCLGGLGIKLAQDILFGEWILQSEGHMVAYDDFKHEGVMLTSQFIGAGPSFITSGMNAAPTLLDVGGGVTVINSAKEWILSGTVDIELTDNYWETSGFLKIRYEW